MPAEGGPRGARDIAGMTRSFRRQLGASTALIQVLQVARSLRDRSHKAESPMRARCFTVIQLMCGTACPRGLDEPPACRISLQPQGAASCAKLLVQLTIATPSLRARCSEGPNLDSDSAFAAFPTAYLALVFDGFRGACRNRVGRRKTRKAPAFQKSPRTGQLTTLIARRTCPRALVITVPPPPGYYPWSPSRSRVIPCARSRTVRYAGSGQRR